MDRPLLHIEVACAENRVIGRDGRLPWSIPEDLDLFHAHTAGHIVLLGRICFETWPLVSADGRTPVVVTSRAADRLSRERHVGKGAAPRTAATFEAALAIADELASQSGREIHICGGERIYAETLALDRPLRLHLTIVEGQIPGDTYFPEWRERPWRELARRESSNDAFRSTFFTLER